MSWTSLIGRGEEHRRRRRRLMSARMSMAIGALLLILLVVSPVAPRPVAAAEVPVIAAASDLQFALPELGAAFAAESGLEVRFATGSSGNFARQIRQGAPYQVFLSADEGYVQALIAEGFAVDPGALYAIGRLALVVPEGSPLRADGTLADLAAALADGRLQRFAIANPEHAPYGRRAEEALRHAGLWEAVRARLVLGENVSQATQYATTGNVDGALVAHSLALAPPVVQRTGFALVPEAWHAPLRQRMVLLVGAGETARRFYDFLQQPAAREIFRRHGFALPGEPG